MFGDADGRRGIIFTVENQLLPANWELKMLFDGLCPACAWEMKVLRRRDRAGKLVFEDIASDSFDPAPYGLTMSQVVGSMHAVRRDGTILRGVDAFVIAYRLIGWNWLARVLEFGPTRPLVDFGYRVFARFRPRFSGFDSSKCGDRCKVR